MAQAEAKAQRCESPAAATLSEQILICYDGSEEAARAVEASALLVHRRATVLTVAPAVTFAEGVVATSSPGSAGALEEMNRADAFKLAEAGAAHARRAGLDAHARAEIASTTWQGIIDVADELDVAAIVIGSHSARCLRELSGGSVTRHVLKHARRPLLIAPPVTT
jgi:nucleotide-binding universal stress UspA family protein